MRNVDARLSGAGSGLLLIGLAFNAASCGSGWAALTGDDTTGGTNPLEIIAMDPPADEDLDPETGPFAESQDEIDITFNMDIDGANIGRGMGTILLFESAPASGGVNVFDEVVDEVIVDGPEVKLSLFEPLRLRDTYYIQIPDGAIASLNGKVFKGAEWQFTVEEGSLRQEELVTFLAPISAISYVPPNSLLSDSTLDAVVMLEGRDGNAPTDGEADFVVAAALLDQDGGVTNPTVLQRNAAANETSLGQILSADTGQTTVVWQRGKPFCSDTNDRTPEAHLFLSQYVEQNGAEGWEILDEDAFADQRGPSGTGIQSTSDNWISWLPRLAYADNGDALAIFWAWTDFDPTIEDFATWAVYSTRRRAGGTEWELPVKISPDAQQGGPHFAWPLVASHPTEDRVYAVFTGGQDRESLYGGQDQALIDQLWIAVYEDGAWTPARQADLDIAGFNRIGRPTSFVIDELGRAVIFMRINQFGVVALGFDLSASIPQVVAGDSLDVSPGSTFWPDGVEYEPNCHRFNINRSFVGKNPPHAILLPPNEAGESRALASWIEQTSIGANEPDVLGSSTNRIDGSGAIWVAEFDLSTGMWVEETAQVVSEQIIPSTVGNGLNVTGSEAQSDRAGNVFIVWSFSESSPTDGLVRSELQAARRDVTTNAWNALAGVVPEGGRNISRAGACAVDGGLTRVHSSGRVIFSWTEVECSPTASILYSLLRRFE